MTRTSILKTSWTYAGGGATLGYLCQAIDQDCPAEAVNVRTDLQVHAAGRLEGYDKERAESAIRQTKQRLV